MEQPVVGSAEHRCFMSLKLLAPLRRARAAFRRPWSRRNVLLSLLGTLTLVGSVACGSDSSPPPSGSPTVPPSSPAATLQSGDFGPLAVIESPGGSDALGGTGPVHIDDDCVTMTLSNGDILLLIWHAAEVRWDEQEQEITFSSAASPDAEPITIRDGDTITVGGASLEGDVPVERNLSWLATPNPACGGELWAVDSVTKH